MTEHQSQGNEVVDGGIIHRCSCGWVSRPCFSNMLASLEGMNHRDVPPHLSTEDERRANAHT